MDSSKRALLFDTTAPAHLTAIGRWLDDNSREQPIFCVGSSAVEAALVAQLEPVGSHAKPSRIAAGARPIAVVSGSCSPITARQIDFASERGFVPIHLSTTAFADEDLMSAACDSVAQAALNEIERGRSPIVYTSHGATDIGDVTSAERSTIERRIGEGLGKVLKALVEQAGLQKVTVAGGDTSGAVARALDLVVLQVAAAVSPGAPLCLGSRRDGSRIEVALKGGQMGGEDFFVRIRET